MPVLLVQVISIAFAVIAAWISAPIVTRFENKGATPHKMAVLHWWTAFVKVVFGAVMVAQTLPNARLAAFTGLFCLLWVYLLFDCILNRLRLPKRPWDYLGLNDRDGRFWNGTFGRDSGKWKAAILFLLITTLNIIFYAG